MDSCYTWNLMNFTTITTNKNLKGESLLCKSYRMFSHEFRNWMENSHTHTQLPSKLIPYNIVCSLFLCSLNDKSEKVEVTLAYSFLSLSPKELTSFCLYTRSLLPLVLLTGRDYSPPPHRSSVAAHLIHIVQFHSFSLAT